MPEQRVLSFFHVLGPVLNILRGFKHLILKTALRIGTAVGFILEKTEAQTDARTCRSRPCHNSGKEDAFLRGKIIF